MESVMAELGHRGNLQGQLGAHILGHKQEAEDTLAVACAVETSEPTASDAPPPTEPHLPILPKQFHQLGAQRANT